MMAFYSFNYFFSFKLLKCLFAEKLRGLRTGETLNISHLLYYYQGLSVDTSGALQTPPSHEHQESKIVSFAPNVV